MRFGFALSSAAVVFLPVIALASRTSDAAQAAVRDLLLSSTGTSRVFISDVKEARQSNGEVRVTGEGVSSERDGWGGVPFRFSISIRDSDLQSRNGMIELRDGRKFGAQTDWGRHINPRGQDVAFTSPRWYETTGGQEVRFSGSCSGSEEVRLSIYDRSGRVVKEGRAAPDRGGLWNALIRLDQGDYRAVAHRRGWSDGDEVRFAVGRASGSWGEGACWTGYRQRGQWDHGWMDSAWGSGSWGSGSWDDQEKPGFSDFRITSPRQNEVVRGNGVVFRGTSSEEIVTIRVYEGSRRIQNERVQVDRNGEWQRTITLEDGRYRFELESGRESRDLNIEVRGGSGGSGGGSLEVTGPRQNEVVRSNRVAFQGYSRERTVSISVYEGSRRIERETVSVGSRGEWSRVITLDDGRYRAVVESGRDSRTLDFEVRGGSGGSGGGSLEVTGPRQNEVVRSNGVAFQGYSRERTVSISVYEGSRRIERETVSVGSRGEWSRVITLDDGRYRAVVESGRDSRTLEFEVRGGTGGSGGGSLEVTGPRQNEVVRSNRVAFQGYSRERTVSISVYEGSRRIERETVSVGSRGEWSRVITLDDGRYRAVVESGRDSRTLDFEVRAGSGGSGGGGAFSVTGPRQNEVVRGSRVHFQGSARERSLTISVYRGSRRVARETVSVESSGRWGRTVTLENGRYRAVVESGRDRREVSFEVRS